MRTKPTTVDPVVAFHSKHVQDVYYFVQAGQLVTVQVQEIHRQYLRRRRRAKHIDDIAEGTATTIGRSIQDLVQGCDPDRDLLHLWVSYRQTACGVSSGKKASELRAVDCPTCLIRMYQTSVANAFVRGAGAA